MELLSKLIFVCPLLFMAGVIDGISGGGGLIALPTYIMTGMPMNFAYGCNKMQSGIGTFAALVKYMKSGFVDLKAALISAATAIIGALVSTRIMLTLDDGTIKIIIVVAMCFIITLMLLMNKVKSGQTTKIELNRQNILRCLAVGLVLGLYDGFFGPGGGTIALMLFAIIFKYDVRTGTGNGKVIIVVSNFIALINYIIEGSILYEIAIPATIANVLGSWLGANLAVKNGRKLVKKMMMAVAVILVIQAVTKLA
ncbi:MAG: sulfite exporter TauE/SafE family protein [Lachnospiraceae bacterium]|nr:sulfite exporter TauE/SafE family protein [Lachnospiraceae bacterium]